MSKGNQEVPLPKRVQKSMGIRDRLIVWSIIQRWHTELHMEGRHFASHSTCIALTVIGISSTGDEDGVLELPFRRANARRTVKDDGNIDTLCFSSGCVARHVCHGRHLFYPGELGSSFIARVVDVVRGSNAANRVCLGRHLFNSGNLGSSY
jgi:hypothetical protein